MAEFEVFWGELYGRTLVYTTSLAMLNPIYPEFTLKCPYCPKYPPTLKLGEKLAANVGNQHPAHAGLILIRSEGESDQLTPGSDQQDPSNLIRSLSRTCRAPRAHATLKLFSPSPPHLLLCHSLAPFATPPSSHPCCLIWATFFSARRSCFLRHNLRSVTFPCFWQF